MLVNAMQQKITRVRVNLTRASFLLPLSLWERVGVRASANHTPGCQYAERIACTSTGRWSMA